MVDFTTPLLPNRSALQALDAAHERGFRAFLLDARHNEQSLDHRKRASEALVELRDGLRVRGPDPDYNDPCVAAAYLVSYHLQHCALAYWSFKILFGQVDIPETLYVCDIGSGTGAGRVGLGLALNEHPSYVNVYLDAVEPSKAMSQAGDYFWESFQGFVADDLNSGYRSLQRLPTAIPKLPPETLRVVTGFHVSMPYDSNGGRLSYYSMARYTSSGNLLPGQKSIKLALNLVKPNAGIFTCHTGKEASLRDAVDSFPDWDEKHHPIAIPNDENGVNSRSSFYTNCAEALGFAVPQGEGSPVSTWSRYRFSPSQGILLLRTAPSQEELLRREQERVAEEERQREREQKRRIEAEERASKEQAEREERARQQQIESERLAAQRAEAERQRREEERKRQEALEQLWATLDSCLESGEVISAGVVGTNSGGLLVKWEGLSGFVPFSHCRDIANRDDAEALAKLSGQSFNFNVLETARPEFKLTRRCVIERAKRTALDSISIGQVLDGQVVHITNMYAFVSVAENCDGKVHILQVAHARVERVSDVVSVGQKVRVKVLRVDVEQNDIWLSIKDALPSPWDDIDSFLRIGDKRTGKVQRIEENKRLVVDIGDSLQGRIHVSQIGNWEIGSFHPGDELLVEVLRIDLANRLIWLRAAEQWSV